MEAYVTRKEFESVTKELRKLHAFLSDLFGSKFTDFVPKWELPATPVASPLPISIVPISRLTEKEPADETTGTGSNLQVHNNRNSSITILPAIKKRNSDTNGPKNPNCRSLSSSGSNCSLGSDTASAPPPVSPASTSLSEDMEVACSPVVDSILVLDPIKTEPEPIDPEPLPSIVSIPVPSTKIRSLSSKAPAPLPPLLPLPPSLSIRPVLPAVPAPAPPPPTPAPTSSMEVMEILTVSGPPPNPNRRLPSFRPKSLNTNTTSKSPPLPPPTGNQKQSRGRTSSSDSSSEPDMIIQCDHCQLFIYSSQLPEHMKNHSKFDARERALLQDEIFQRPQPCQLCQIDCENFQAYERHCAKYHPEGLPCPLCGKKLSRGMRLRRHMLIHRNLKFSCETCGKSYNRRDNMIAHAKTHEQGNGESADNLFYCGICKRAAFSSREGRDRHMKASHPDFDVESPVNIVITSTSGSVATGSSSASNSFSLIPAANCNEMIDCSAAEGLGAAHQFVDEGDEDDEEGDQNQDQPEVEDEEEDEDVIQLD